MKDMRGRSIVSLINELGGARNIYRGNLHKND